MDKEKDFDMGEQPTQDEAAESELIDVFEDAPVEEPEEEDPDEEFDIEERDYRPVRTRRDGKLGCLGGIMYAVFVISLSIILACVGWMSACDVLALNKEYATASVTLPKDIFSTKMVDVKDEDGNVTGQKEVQVCDIKYVATALKDAGIIEYKWLFRLFAGISNADVKMDPGTYNLTTEMDYRFLVKYMQAGTSAMETTKLTFPEGYTMAQIFQKLEDAEICSVDDLMSAAESFNYNFRFLENAEPGDPLRLEGFIFPNTYDFYQGEQAASVINKFLNALHSRVTADMWTQVENLGITFRQAVTIASMIEKESADDQNERANIASVIYNRLRNGMALGIDSTILYVHPEYEGDSNIPQEILEEDSPYNTRLYTGLPPTPICNPGIASINAALNPASTNYLYYALDVESGTHRFFTNYSDFQAFSNSQNYGG